MSLRVRIVGVGALLVGGLTLQALSQDAADAVGAPPPAVAPAPADADLSVWLEHVGGKVSSYREEIVQLDLILDTAGRLDQVHLILRSGPEADTHVWYNVDNLVSVRYQFLKITGKGKVAVRTVVPPATKPSTGTPPRPVEALDSEDYR